MLQLFLILICFYICAVNSNLLLLHILIKLFECLDFVL